MGMVGVQNVELYLQVNRPVSQQPEVLPTRALCERSEKLSTGAKYPAVLHVEFFSKNAGFKILTVAANLVCRRSPRLLGRELVRDEAGNIVPGLVLSRLLAEKGWTNELRDHEFHEECTRELGEEYNLTALWSDAVLRYGRYRFYRNGSKDRRDGLSIVIDPLDWSGMADDFLYYSDLVGEQILPFASVGTEQIPFAVGVEGKGYCIGHTIFRWSDYLSGVESIILGRGDGEVVG